MPETKENIIRLYDVRPDLALAHLRRVTGLGFDPMPPNLAKGAPDFKPDCPVVRLPHRAS